MKNILPFLILFSSLFIISGCQKEDPSPTVKQPAALELPAKANDVISNSNDFGVEMFRAVALEEDQNIMLSPLSASVALTMLLNGCESETYAQIHQMLGYDGYSQEEVNSVYQALEEQLLSVDPEVELALANAVWYRESFQVKPPYLETMKEVFDATIEGLDFSHPSALEVMNQWASDNTNGKIDQVLNEISPMAVMFLMNALYFKGEWTWQFDAEETEDAVFYLQDGAEVQVPTMQGHIPIKSYLGESFAAAELFYGRQNFSMVLVVPDNLGDFLETFEPDVWRGITTSLDHIEEPSKIDIFLPKFSFEYEKKLNEVLQAMGMTDAFIPELADLSGISDAAIYVSFVKQNTFIDVNEEGTEAAAVTTIGVEYTSIESFIVDRPFIFAIRERTSNTLMFMGMVVNPDH